MKKIASVTIEVLFVRQVFVWLLLVRKDQISLADREQQTKEMLPLMFNLLGQ